MKGYLIIFAIREMKVIVHIHSELVKTILSTLPRIESIVELLELYSLISLV